MRFALPILVLSLTSLPALAATTADEICNVTAEVVTKAQDLRLAGMSQTDVVAQLSADYADRGTNFTGQAIPMLVNDFVYVQPEDVVKSNDLSAAWKQVCLTTDLSSVLGAD